MPISPGLPPPHCGTLTPEVIFMPRLWAGFSKPSVVLSLLQQTGQPHNISILIRDPGDGHDIVITGPISRDMGRYPFLDLAHQIRRCGIQRTQADRYLQILQKGGALICIDEWDVETIEAVRMLDAQEIYLIDDEVNDKSV